MVFVLMVESWQLHLQKEEEGRAREMLAGLVPPVFWGVPKVLEAPSPPNSLLLIAHLSELKYDHLYSQRNLGSRSFYLSILKP